MTLANKITAGDTLSFLTTVADYPASAGWVLVYLLIPRDTGSAITLTGSAEGNDHRIEAGASVTALWTPGHYSWVTYATMAGERYTLQSGQVEILPNPATQTSYDARSPAALIVDQLMAAYTTYSASQGNVAEYEIAGRKMKYRSSAEILDQLNHWKAILAAEKRAERINAGLGAGNKLLTRF